MLKLKNSIFWKLWGLARGILFFVFIPTLQNRPALAMADEVGRDSAPPSRHRRGVPPQRRQKGEDV